MYLGAKIGILGANGAGKSSVLRILAGEDDQFDGHIDKSPGIRVTHLKQARPPVVPVRHRQVTSNHISSGTLQN